MSLNFGIFIIFTSIFLINGPFVTYDGHKCSDPLVNDHYVCPCIFFSEIVVQTASSKMSIMHFLMFDRIFLYVASTSLNFNQMDFLLDMMDIFAFLVRQMCTLLCMHFKMEPGISSFETEFFVHSVNMQICSQRITYYDKKKDSPVFH